LETRWDAEGGRLRAGAGVTDLFVRPPFDFRAADALLTNFHLPRSSLLMLAAAFAAPGCEEGIAWVKEAYRHALAAGYRFFSYGDACFFE
jgi:S-adenosylmethionine:tRNA ribosyltransferase-isomerase